MSLLSTLVRLQLILDFKKIADALQGCSNFLAFSNLKLAFPRMSCFAIIAPLYKKTRLTVSHSKRSALKSFLPSPLKKKCIFIKKFKKLKFPNSYASGHAIIWRDGEHSPGVQKVQQSFTSKTQIFPAHCYTAPVIQNCAKGLGKYLRIVRKKAQGLRK